MPHQTCTICEHKDLDAINLALRTSACPLRALAVRHGVSKTSLLRHKSHIDGAAPRMNTAEIDAIDTEIARIKRALRKAQRSRTKALVVNLSRELRSWIGLKAKVQGSMPPAKDAPAASVSERDALSMAVSIIEASVAGDRRQQVLEWLSGLLERLRPADAAAVQETASEETSENRDNSGTGELKHVQAAE